MAILLLLGACVTTKTTGFVDPDYSNGHYKIKKIAVRASGASLEETMRAESELVAKLSNYGVDAVRYIDIVPPTRNYDMQQAMSLVNQADVDSMFITSLDNLSSVDSYVPQTYHPGKTTGTVNAIGNTAYINTYTSPGYTTGGYTVSQPTMSTSSYLYDMSNGRKVWQAEGFSKGKSYSSYADLLVSAGKSAISDLESKGLLTLVEKGEVKEVEAE